MPRRRLREIAAVLLVAASAARACAGPADALDASLRDARKQPVDVAQTTHYLSMDPIPVEQRETFLRVLSYHVNSLSRESEIYPPRVVSANVLAVNRLHYRWDAKLFDRLADIDPYWHSQIRFVDYGHREGERWVHHRWVVESKITALGNVGLDPVKLTELANLTNSKAPILDARWFLVQTCRQVDLRNRDNGAGYLDFLGVKKRADAEKIAKFREQDSIDLGKEIRAVVDKSGVAIGNRQIIRFRALTGAWWITLDTDDSTGVGNATQNLEAGTFKHKAEEIVYFLPNELFGYFAGDDKGNVAKTVPDNIAHNDSPLNHSRDMRIHSGPIGCASCHDLAGGLKPIDDWVRNTLRPPLGIKSTDYAKLLRLQRQYFSNLDAGLEQDRAVYAAAVKKCNNWTVAENIRAYVQVYDSYALADWGRPEVASQAGVTEERLLAALRKYAAAAEVDARLRPLDAALAGLIQTPPVSTRAEKIEEVWPILLGILAVY